MEAGGGSEAPGHGGRVVGQAEASVGTEKDDAAVSAEAVEEVGDGLLCGHFGGGAFGDAVGGPLAEDQLHDGFSPAGEGDGSGEIVGVTATPDEGGVADAAGSLVESAAGRGGGGQVAMGIEGDCADGVMAAESGRVRVGRKSGLGTFVVVEDVAREGFVGQAGGLAGLGMGEALAFAVENQFSVVDKGHAVRLGELLGTVADEVDVGALFEDKPRGLNGVAEMLNTGNAASLHATPIHEKRIQLHTAIGGKEAAATGIEGGIVFKDGDRGFNSIEGGSSAGEKGVAGFKGIANAGFVSGCGVGGNGPCAAVNEKSGNVRGGDRHRDMVAQLSGVRGEESKGSGQSLIVGE